MQSLALYRQISHKWGIARSLSGLAQADADDGNYLAAETHFRQALELQQEIGDRRSQAHSLHRLAILLRNAGKGQEAVPLARQSYDLYFKMGDHAGMAWSAQILAECLNFEGATDEALTLLHQAEALAEDLGDASRLANIYQELTMLLGRIGQHHEAQAIGEKGLALARRLGQPIRVAWSQLMLASLDLSAGAYALAESRSRESEQILGASARGHELAVVYALQAAATLMQGDYAKARQLTAASLRLNSRHRDYRIFLGLRPLVLLLARTGQIEEAITAFGHLKKWPPSASGLSESWIEEQIAPQTESMPPDVVNDLLAQAQKADTYEFAALWAAKQQLPNPVAPS
ncbi:MAG: tetratricopeptide repeat protein [Caldilineaceae bacterium]|nr:tetratricopeptide repeat protein [Caldilineaceae bacterium]